MITQINIQYIKRMTEAFVTHPNAYVLEMYKQSIVTNIDNTIQVKGKRIGDRIKSVIISEIDKQLKLIGMPLSQQELTNMKKEQFLMENEQNELEYLNRHLNHMKSALYKGI